MAYKVVITSQAEADIGQAFGYLGEHSPEAATRWYRRVRDAIASLTKLPMRCPLAPEARKLGTELRQLLHGRHPGVYRIVFRVGEEDKEVHVLTIRHSAREALSTDEMQLFLEQD